MLDAPSPPPSQTSAGHLDALMLATVFLTRLPLRLHRAPEPALYPRAMGWYPLVGAALGLFGGGVFALATLAHLPATVAAVVTVAALAWATGGLHEDGLADVADGLGGGRSRERALEIMRDSRVGSYGVLAVVLAVALRVSALAALGTPEAVAAALVTAAAWSRAVLPLLARMMAPARTDGLAASHGRPSPADVALALVLALVLTTGAALATVGGAAPIAALAALAAAVLVGRLAQRRLNGYTGDVLGATQQAAEIAVLLTLTALR